MNKKGFTLVELLAIVILLAGVFMLVYPKLTEMFEKENKKIDDDKLEIIYNAVDRYLDGNDKYPPIVGAEYCITIKALDYEGLIPGFNDNEYINKAVRIKIGKSNNYYEIITKCLDENN